MNKYFIEVKGGIIYELPWIQKVIDVYGTSFEEKLKDWRYENTVIGLGFGLNIRTTDIIQGWVEEWPD